MSDFKKQVRIELIHKGMTMKDLADEMGISVSYLSELLNGTRTNQAQLVLFGKLNAAFSVRLKRVFRST